MSEEEAQRRIQSIAAHEIEFTINGLGEVCVRCKTHARGNDIASPKDCTLAIAVYLAELTDIVDSNVRRTVEGFRE